MNDWDFRVLTFDSTLRNIELANENSSQRVLRMGNSLILHVIFIMRNRADGSRYLPFVLQRIPSPDTTDSFTIQTFFSHAKLS